MLAEREMCTGCGACGAVCPKGCIRMEADAQGFLYPEIHRSQCVNCGLCEKVCPVIHGPQTGPCVHICAVQNRDSQLRQESSSGGVFSALAETVLVKGGAVCAAVYNENFGVEHRIAFRTEELVPMRGAKYAQSHAGHLFRQLKSLLGEGTPVMFVGTPCQCAALRSYLGKAPENLLLVDMICHGVPSPDVWKAYVDCRSRLDGEGAKATAINLRDKTTGWSRYGYSVRFQYPNGNVYCVPQGQDPYMRGFVGDLFSRPSCSQCAFKGIHRCSDLTLGDCWGIWDTHPDFDDNRGTSLLLVQSEKGQQMWQNIQENFRVMPWTVEDVRKWNPSAVCASAPHAAREMFFIRLREGEPADRLIEELLIPKPPRQSRIKGFLRRLGFGL